MLGDFGPDGLQFRQLGAFDPRLQGGRRVKVESGRISAKFVHLMIAWAQPPSIFLLP